MNEKSIIPAAVVALVVSLLAITGFAVMQPDPSPSLPQGATVEDLGGISGVVLDSPYVFKNGAGFGGKFLSFTVDGEIGPGANQGAWRNTTNRKVFISAAALGFETGTASSSMNIYAATSTSATLTDYVAPGGLYRLINGASFATSTPNTRIFTSTTTADGNTSSFYVAPGEYVVFMVSEKFGCKTVGACETATSTNRGISKFFWTLRGHFKP